jgi:hypothetical protein
MIAKQQERYIAASEVNRAVRAEVKALREETAKAVGTAIATLLRETEQRMQRQIDELRAAMAQLEAKIESPEAPPTRRTVKSARSRS